MLVSEGMLYVYSPSILIHFKELTGFQAEMELALIVATVFRRYEFELYQGELETREGFLRKPLGLEVGMRRRQSKS